MKPLVLLFCMNMFSGMGYSIVAPLFSTFENYFHIDEAAIGWIISTFAILNTIVTPLVPRLCKQFSRIKLLYFATLVDATSTFLYAFLEKIPNLSIFLVIIFIIRIFHGIGSAFIGTLVYSIACSIANENELKTALGYIEIGLSLGSSSGPLFASLFYSIGGYSCPFIVLGLFLYISVYLTKLLEKEKIDNNEESKEEPSFFQFFFYFDIILISGAFTSGMLSFTYFFPCLSNHLIKNYNLNISTSSLFFSIPVISYLIMINLTNMISNRIGNFYSICIGLFINCLGIYMVYPLYPFPKNIFSIIIGLLLIGAGGPLIFIIGLLSLTRIIKKINNNYDKNTINDIASAMNNFFISIGDLLGPIIGGFLTSYFSFKICCLLLSVIFFCFFIVFYLKFKSSIDDDITIDTSENENTKSNNNIELNKILLK